MTAKSSPDAQTLRLVRYLLAQGAGREEIADAAHTASLGPLALDLALRRPGEELSFEQAARAAGLDLESAGRLWRALGLLGRDQVERLVADLARDGLAAKTIRNVIGLLNGILEYAIRHRWTAENACRYIDLPTVGLSEDIRFLEPEELEAVLRAVDGQAAFGRVQHAVILAAAMSGLRLGELRVLRWRDVDWQAQRIRVRRSDVRGHIGTPKSRRGSRSVPLADRLGGELDVLHRHSAYQADDDLVFGNPHTGTPLDGAALLRAFRRALERAGVRKVRFHDLRHTFGTRTAGAGVPMRTLQEWMGHRDLRTTLIYADYAPGAHED
jgi:integrase